MSRLAACSLALALVGGVCGLCLGAGCGDDGGAALSDVPGVGVGADVADSGSVAAVADVADIATSSVDDVPPDAAPSDAGAEAHVDASADGLVDAGPGAPAELVVHEWGTLSVFVGSDGVQVEGLHHAEESLPGFVARRDVGATGSGASELMPEGATVKLQNPALYVHGEDPDVAELNVGVSWAAGVLTASWPPFATESPAVGALAALADGSASWTVQVDTPDATLEAVAFDSLWTWMRTVSALTLADDADAAERFLFFGGVGRMTLPVTIAAHPDTPEWLRVVPETADADPIPAAWYVYVHDGGGLVYELGPLDGPQDFFQAPTPKEIDGFIFVQDAVAKMEAALVERGLYEDEAAALVATWSHNVFATHGRRLLFIMPPSVVDAALPVSITPEPAARERVYIGRVELLLPNDEAELLETLASAEASGAGPEAFAVEALGVFAESKLRRAAALADAPELKAFIEALVLEAATLP